MHINIIHFQKWGTDKRARIVSRTMEMQFEKLTFASGINSSLHTSQSKDLFYVYMCVEALRVKYPRAKMMQRRVW